MTLKDYIYDSERKVATIWLEKIEPDHLTKLLAIFRASNPEPKKDFDFDSIIFDEPNTE